MYCDVHLEIEKIVLKIIEISFIMDCFLIYSIFSFVFSGMSISLLKSIGFFSLERILSSSLNFKVAKEVIPGLTDSMISLSFNGIRNTKLSKSGLGPTNDISPKKILNNWGNSSNLYLLIS